MPRLFVVPIATGAVVCLATAGALAQDPPVTPSVSVVQEAPSPAAVVAPPAPSPVAVVAPPAPSPAAVVVKADDRSKDTTRELEDGGLGLEWIYLNADVGAAYTDLVSLRSSPNWALTDNSASGPAFGVGAGVRLVFLTAGIRVRDLELSSFNVWETDLEAALHFRIWRIDGYVGARGGYVFLGQFSADSLRTATTESASDVTVHGWNVGPTAGLDFYISKRVSLGVDANLEVLFLERPPLTLPAGDTVSPEYASLYQDSGSSVGAGFLATSHLGIHF
jgi:hypothetical protein